MLESTILFLKNIRMASEIRGSRGPLDIFTDRVTRSVSEPTLAGAMEHLMRSCLASADKASPVIVTKMTKLATSADAPKILRWLREHTRLAVVLSAADDDTAREALAEVTLSDTSANGAAAKRQPFNIPIKVVCEAPLAHGADGKAGNATMFRRIDVLATNGARLSLPYYSGNAVRGQLRDLMGDHLIKSIGLDRSRLALWFFYALYSGGTLEEKSAGAGKVAKSLGSNGATRADGVREFRNFLPALSILGCALGNRILPGRIQVGDLRPVCLEWGTGAMPVVDLMTWEFLTRREDDEGHVDNHSMIATTECLATGTELEGGIDMGLLTDLEQSALGCGMSLLAKRGMLGAENRRGLGRVSMSVTNAPDERPYLQWLGDCHREIAAYLVGIEAIKKDDGE